MFKLSPAPVFACDIHISTPAGPVLLPIKFRHQGKKALKDWSASAAGRSDADVLAQVIVSWSVIDDAGLSIDFSKTALETLLDEFPPAARQIYVGYLKAINEGVEKN